MIYGFMRIKNEARWIARVLASMSVCDQILILDDHSTDETREICRAFPKVTLFESPFEGVREDRDKNYLLEKLEEVAKDGDLVVSIDGDEEIAAGGREIIEYIGMSLLGAGVSGPPNANAWRFQVLYLWDRPDQIRVDRWYSSYTRPSLFRLRKGARFTSDAGGGFHCGNVPEITSLAHCDVKLLHYGYMHREDRIRKFEWYNSIKPVPLNEDGYRHMVVGDLFPSDCRFVHAGPLELRQL